MFDANEILTVRQMADRLGVPAIWLRIEAAQGRIPCIRAMHEFLFNPSAVVVALSKRAAAADEEVSVDGL